MLDILEEYIKAYVNAQNVGNEKEMKIIEADLEKLGMDKHTLEILVREVRCRLMPNSQY